MSEPLWDENKIADYIQSLSTDTPRIDIYNQVEWVKDDVAIGLAMDVLESLQQRIHDLEAQLSAPAASDGDGLALCAHCGGNAWVYDFDTEIDMWPVRCNNTRCNAQVCSPISQEDAIARWNRRTPKPALPQAPSYEGDER